VLQITAPVLIGMAYDGILTVVEAGSHLSVATLHLPVVTLMRKKWHYNGPD